MAKPITQKHLEIETYNHAGIRVTVEIDYAKETISLLDSPQKNAYKKWVFAGRQLEYMQGWRRILDAMLFAIDTASAKLKKHVDAVERDKARLMKIVLKKTI